MKANSKNLFNKGIRNPTGVLNFIINLPKLFKLYYRLFKDPRTPFYLKLILTLTIIYVISPIDLFPDLMIPIIGHVDDLIIMIAALQYFLKKCPPEIVAEHIQAIQGEEIK